MKNGKLKICFLGEAKDEDIHTLKWAKYFSDRGHDVHLFSYSNFGKNRVEAIKLHLLEKKFKINLWPFNTIINLPFTILHVRKMIKEIRPDLIHAHCITSYGTLASLTNFHPFILTVWGSDVFTNVNLNFLTRLGTKHAIKKADLLTCGAKNMKSALINLGAIEEKIKIVSYGVDTKIFSPGLKDKEFMKKIGAVDGKTIISLRLLKSISNIETLIKAVPLVVKEISDAKFLIIGDGEEKDNLIFLAKSLGVYDNINFLGWVAPSDVPKFILASDVCVSTSLYDGGLSSGTAEAMATELVPVITDFGDNKIWINEGINGFLFPEKNYKTLAEKLIYLLKNEKERKIMGINARKIIEEKDNHYTEMERMENFYKGLIKQ